MGDEMSGKGSWDTLNLSESRGSEEAPTKRGRLK